MAVATLLLIIDLFDFFNNRLVRYTCYLVLGVCAVALFYLSKHYEEEKQENEE
ncbi:hypothetical protein [Myroides sp. N17-2]|uniref:hypothetical protein n=1 Tax=Myroides sp. N17-2 TaxID=2030799 RepID=UPI00130410A3|nr:hypothetical protein [Myroides sp. N17-2]